MTLSNSKKWFVLALSLYSASLVCADEGQQAFPEPPYRVKHLLVQLKTLEEQVAQMDKRYQNNASKSEEIYLGLRKQIQDLEREVSSTYAKAETVDELLASELEEIQQQIEDLRLKHASNADQALSLQEQLGGKVKDLESTLTQLENKETNASYRIQTMDKRVKELEGDLVEMGEKGAKTSQHVQEVEASERQVTSKEGHSRARLDNLAIQVEEMNRRLAKLETKNKKRG
jgi:chromosome segregation ATPase